MQVVVGGQEVDVTVVDPDVPCAELGGRVPSSLRRGEVLDAMTAPSPGAASLAVVGGLDAGRRVPLPAGCTVLGAHDIDDATVSAAHLRVEVGAKGSVGVADLGSRNGTWILDPDGDGSRSIGADPVAVLDGAELRLGATTLAIRSAGAAAADRPLPGPGRPTAAGTRPFNRPPRAAPPASPAAIEVPAPPSPRTGPTPLGVMAVLAPLAMAGAMVLLLGNPLFALFALLSPVLAVGHHVEGKRRARTTGRADGVRRAAAIRRLRGDVERAGRVERRRRLLLLPDLEEVTRRASQPSTRLWERRPEHLDHLAARLGTGDVPWDPPLDEPGGGRPDDVAAVVSDNALLPRCPVAVDLAQEVVGIVGPRRAALAVARSLVVQTVVHHGPADVALLVACTRARATDWRWVGWLPHLDGADGEPRLVIGAAIDDLGEGGDPFVVVDGDGLLDGRRSPLRTLLGSAGGIVLAASVDRLPASCGAVVVLDGHDGDAELRRPALGTCQRVHVDGLSAATSLDVARALAAFHDPEQPGSAAALPPTARLPALLGFDVCTAAAVAERWAAAGADPAPATVLGLSAEGPVEIDLVVDGPHALVAGTTGSGKSELLRTLIAGLACASDPEHLTFVLVDFKGGAAFDACARLPHVVGLVTDLDAGLPARALRCLEAELRHREGVLRAAGVSDLATHRRAVPDAPLARLVVVVDEFATLKSELPDFVDKLVGIAQRGRSLGVHLVLATQRPAGAVSDAIRANTDLRIALRVLDARDSIDVIDGPDAASLARTRPGRACLRRDDGEVLVLQTALVTAASMGPVSRVEVRPVPWAACPPAGSMPGPTGIDGPTDLDLLVDACSAAWAATGRPAPRRPWPEPLPAVLDGPLPGCAAALADDPDQQRQIPLAWVPVDGNLVLVGATGSGTTTAAISVAVAAASERGPDELHLYAIDHGAGDLGRVAALPHCGAVVTATDLERQRRLVRWLRRELDVRRTSGCRAPALVLVVDGIGAFLAGFDDAAGLEVLDSFARIWSDGPELGIHVVAAADRLAAVPAALLGVTTQRWLFRSADDAATRGEPDPPGRFVAAPFGLRAHIARPDLTAACGWPAPAVRPHPVETLPTEVALTGVASVASRPWRLPMAVGDDDLGPAALSVWPGDHLMVIGPGRAGRTSALAAIGTVAVRAGVDVVVLDRPRSWLREVAGFRVVDSIDAVSRLDGRPTLVLVDDAEGVDDESGALAALVAHPPTDLHVVAAARPDALRGLYAHWTRAVRRSRLGLLLQPDPDLDGELLGASLPRRVPLAMVAGRGFLVVDGAATLVQVGRP